MKRKIHYALLTLTICLIFAGQAFSADASKAGIQHKGDTNLLGPQRSTQIQGMSVENPQGQKLGKIDDLVISENGAIKYAILSHGGLLGIGNKLIPLPWRALKPGKDEKTLMVNITKETLEKAPNFDSKEWPKFTEPEWQKKVEVYYEIPASQASTDR